MAKKLKDYPKDFMKLIYRFNTAENKAPGSWFHRSYPYFLDPVLCPSFPKNHIVTARKLQAFEDYYRNLRVKGYGNKKWTPYVSLLEASPNLKSNKRVLLEQGWELAPDQMTNNYWKKPVKVDELNKAYHFEVGGYQNKRLQDDFWRLSEICFGPEVSKFRAINMRGYIYHKERMPAYVVNIYKKDKIIAASSVFVDQDYAWLVGACVHPRYQNKGLWKQLLFQRQAIAAGMGVEKSFLTTSNDLIRAKADEYINYHIFRKP